jgi:hypothetical protein
MRRVCAVIEAMAASPVLARSTIRAASSPSAGSRRASAVALSPRNQVPW